VTEKSYFDIIKGFFPGVVIKCYHGKKDSSPQKILELAKQILLDSSRIGSGKIWILMDKNSWKKEHLDELVRWAKKKMNCHVAISNPKFEYWILLHFELAGSVSSRECSDMLSKHLPDFRKRLRTPLTLKQVTQAVIWAKQRDIPPCTGWPNYPGQTTVYRLLESIQRANEEYFRRISLGRQPRKRLGSFHRRR